MLKKLIAVVLTAALMFGAVVLPMAENGVDLASVTASAATNATYGDYSYEILYDGTVAITGYNGNSKSITIPSKIYGKKVTNIGYRAFYGHTSLTSVTIPDGVTIIEDYTFSLCTSLTSVTIPDSVTSIGDSAFYHCTSLTSVKIPDGVTNIGNGAFSECTNLTSVTIPTSVKDMGPNVFFNTPWLANKQKENPLVIVNGILIDGTTCKGRVVIPDSVKSIGGGAFFYCTSLTSIKIPDSVTSIGDEAFFYCTSLTSIKIPDSVTSIGDYAFENCTSLTSIKIPDSVTSIGDFAFEDCINLTNITIPDSVTKIHGNPFSNTPWLTKKQKENPLVVVNGILIDGTTCKGRVVIPDSVISIGDKAFFYCTSLTSITIPDSVTSIGNRAFFYCTSLTNITIPDSVKSIDWDAFNSCTSLTSITIPNSVTSIGHYAFYQCDSLKSVTIPQSVTEIGIYAFGYQLTYADNKLYSDFTIFCYPNTAGEKYAKENNIKYELIDTSKGFIYDDPNTFVADGLLNRAVMPGGDIMQPVSDKWADLPVQREFIYEQIGKEISENTAKYGSALFWQNLEKCLKGDFIGMASWQEIMYESLIIDYLAYNGESEEFKSDFNDKATGFAKDITDELAGKGINNLDNLSLADAKKYAKTIKWSKRLSNYNDILSDVTDIATTGFDYYEKLSKALAVNQVNEERLDFLKEIKNNSTDQHLNNAVDKVIGYYNSSIADTAFKYCDDYATKFLVERSWSAFISDASKVCPAVGQATSLLKLGTAGFDWLFNTDDISSAMLETVAIYNMGAYAEKAYVKSRDSYSASGKAGVPGDSEKADKFVGAYENYIIFKNYANTIVDKYLYERLCEGMHGSISAAIQDILTYSNWSSAIDIEKTSSNYWLSMMNSYRNYYFTFSGYNAQNAHTHTWNSGVVTKAATCASTGVKTYTCTVCKATKTETIAKTTSHKYDSGKVTKAATYGATGVKTYTCTVCGAKKTSSIAKKTVKKLTAKTTYSCTTNAVRINWNKLSGVTGYKIFRYDDAKKKWVAVKAIYDPNTTNYKISGLKSGKVYKFRVKAFVKENGKFYFGESCSTISTATRPNTTTVTKANKTSTAVRLFWKKTTCTGYRILRYDSATKKWVRVTAVGSSATTQYKISALKKNTTYKFKVQPCVKVGGKVIDGAASKEFTVKTSK